MSLRTSVHGPWWRCDAWPGCRGKQDASGLDGAPVRSQVVPPAPTLGPRMGDPPARGVAPGGSDDAHQREAIGWRSGWAVVAAAAGSGKSHVLIERTASLLAEGAVPESILMLAYNASAAELLRKRLAARCGPDGARVDAYTFHAWCYALLRNWYPQDPRFLPGHLLGGRDGPHPIKVAIPICDAVGREHKEDLPFGLALRAHERWSETLLPLGEREVATAMGWWDGKGACPREAAARAVPLVDFLGRYRDEKRKRDLIDFTDMLCDVARAITWQRDEPHVQALKALYRHVVTDEAQDMSLPRAIVAQWLGQGAESFLAVGDCRQAINAWAGAKPSIFVDLATAPGVKLLTLPVNRRSTRRIVEAANEVARDRDWNLGGDCSALPTAAEGEPVQVWETENASEEARDVISDIQRRVARGLPLEVDGRASYCCVGRTNAMLVDLECAFVARGIPVRVSGSPGGIWGSSVGQEMLAYLEGAAGVASFSLLNVLNKPKRFAKKADLGDVIERAHERVKGGATAALHDNLRAHTSRGIQALGADLSRAGGQPWVGRCLTVARWLGLDDADEEEAGEDRRAALEALMRLAQQLGSLDAVREYREKVARSEREPSAVLSTVHACVAPDTLVETSDGLRRIKDIPIEGVIATALGPATYQNRVAYDRCSMLQITTTRGYRVDVTTDHGMFSWNDHNYHRVVAEDLKLGDFLRLKPGVGVEPSGLVALPPLRPGDVRAREWRSPAQLTEGVAEFFGMMVADGTVYKAGFRLTKRHPDVITRFQEHVAEHFGVSTVRFNIRGTYEGSEANSTSISSWLLSIGGMAPHAKAVPEVVLRSPVNVQAAFLRGLFEDGTVNPKKGVAVSWTTVYETMARTVQVMLLRIGIVTTRYFVQSLGSHGAWRVDAYGQYARLFRDRVGFISAFKQTQLEHAAFSGTRRELLPVQRRDARLQREKTARQNSRSRGRIERATAERIGGFEEELSFFHDRVASIVPYEGSSMCVDVPEYDRFLQNGFDGANSKGKEWPVVYACGVCVGKLPHKRSTGEEEVEEERRLLYVAVTRARDALVVSTGGPASPFLSEIGWCDGVR